MTISGWILLVYLADTVTAVSAHSSFEACERARSALQQQHIESVCAPQR